MYAPPPAARSTPRWFWFVIGFVVLMLVAAAVTATLLLTRRFGGGPRQGDVAYTLQLTGLDGAAPAKDAVEQTRGILLDRLRQLDVGRPSVTVTAADTLRVTAAHADAERAKGVLAPGDLTFRKVLDLVDSGDPGPDCRADVGVPDPAGALASARNKLGETVWAKANGLKDATDPDAKTLTGFEKLTCAEIGVLPPLVQFAAPGVGCTALDHRTGPPLAPRAKVTACGEREKYQLDVAGATGADLQGAQAGTSPANGAWTITLRFTAAGQERWTGLTREALQQQVAILVDNTVISAPMIQSVIPGDAEIAGGFTADSAKALAARLGHGALPTRIAVTATDTVR
ncbi:hypothetical protein Dvina_14680 [Dactylosporangium vinaceum]|uniref:SecDF P1 head subdomain domain-containing protein n=1 Tax=Dactylosporangium vinaceum TaxID=53362 RepID=A0ABV5M1H7_9ACTN|nr:hypothetical protein [Dactylosporangium vinaceum]UAB99207.1 hypothetical protein Dvina_14680 [Dactylosporangium vinaceum]